METITSNFMSSNALALLISSLIFIITLFLVTKNLISFVITCVLLFFAVVAGFAIANNDIVRERFQMGERSSLELFDYAGDLDDDSRIKSIKDKMWTIFEQLVETLSNQSDDDGQDGERQERVRRSVTQVLEELDINRAKLQAILDKSSAPRNHGAERRGG